MTTDPVLSALERFIRAGVPLRVTMLNSVIGPQEFHASIGTGLTGHHSTGSSLLHALERLDTYLTGNELSP